MANIKSDNPIDHELVAMKRFADELKKTQAIFSNGFQSLPIKERARLIHKIQSDQKTLSAFIEKAKRTEINNSGSKFTLENLKQTQLSLHTLWRKTEKMMENSGLGGASSGSSVGVSGSEQQPRLPQTPQTIDPTSKASQDYAQVLKSIGHNPTTDQINQFKSQIDGAYKAAIQKTGGKDLDIKVSYTDGKISVKMEPKK